MAHDTKKSQATEIQWQRNGFSRTTEISKFKSKKDMLISMSINSETIWDQAKLQGIKIRDFHIENNTSAEQIYRNKRALMRESKQFKNNILPG